jgi:hypothetical protein
MRMSSSWSAFVAGVLVSAPQSALGQKSPYENLVLADCGIGLGVNGGATSQDMMYYSGDVWTGNGDATNSVHGWMNYNIQCEKSGLECAICNAIGTALTVPSPSAGVTVLLGCQAACS